MTMWRRLVKAGRAALSAFNQKDLVPIEDFGWDDYYARLARYDFGRACYSNVQYRNLAAFASTYKTDRGLYKYIREIYNPVNRLVGMYVSKMYGGNLDMEDAKIGAIPIAMADDTLRQAITQLWKWSNWGTSKSLYSRLGTMLGDVVLKVIDDRVRERVRIEVVDPAKLYDVELDEVGNVKAATFSYLRVDPDDPNAVSYTYTEILTKETFSTYKNGELFAFYADASGEPVAEWPNEYGFVPVVLTGYEDLGLTFRATPYNNAIGKIDELNDAASILNDQIRKTQNPMWYFSGVRGSTDLKVAAGEKRDELPAVYGPSGSSAQAMVAGLDLAGALSNLQSMLEELERDMPELALARLRQQGGDLTAPGVRTGFSDAIGRIDEARGNFDDALTRAQMMGVSIGGFNKYSGFLAYSLDSYNKGDLAHYIAERPVIADSLSTMERIGVLQQIDGKPADRLILAELGVPKDEIDEVMLAAEERSRQEVRAFADGVFGEVDDGAVTEEEETSLEARPESTAGQFGGGASEAPFE